MVGGLPWFILVLIIVVATLLWDLLQGGVLNGLEWLFVRLGLSGPRRLYQMEDHQNASILEPFKLAADGENAKGKVYFCGEIWNAV